MKRALVVLHDGFEEIEAVTVIDVMRRAGIDVCVCSTLSSASVTGSHGMELSVSHALGDEALELQGAFDAIVLPGGMKGVEGLLASEKLVERICAHDARGGVLAAVCAAPLVLAQAGVLEGRRITCHPIVRDRIGREVVEAPFVIDGRVVTGRSAGCSLPWSIALVGVLLGAVPQALIDGLCIHAFEDMGSDLPFMPNRRIRSTSERA